jgi:WD40 repeat protein
MVSLQDGTIYIWDVATSKLIKTIEYNGILTCSKFINNSTILSAITTKNKNSSKDHHSIMRYDLKSSNNLQPISLKGSLWSVSDIYYQEGSKNIIVEDISNKIYIYDIDSGRKIFDSSGSRKLRILNEGKMIVCRDGIKIIQFRIPSREEIIEIAKSKMNGYVLSEDDKEEYYLK